MRRTAKRSFATGRRHETTRRLGRRLFSASFVFSFFPVRKTRRRNVFSFATCGRATAYAATGSLQKSLGIVSASPCYCWDASNKNNKPGPVVGVATRYTARAPSPPPLLCSGFFDAPPPALLLVAVIHSDSFAEDESLQTYLRRVRVPSCERCDSTLARAVGAKCPASPGLCTRGCRVLKCVALVVHPQSRVAWSRSGQYCAKTGLARLKTSAN